MQISPRDVNVTGAIGQGSARRHVAFGGVAVILLAALIAWAVHPASTIDLGRRDRLRQTGIFSEWASGNLVVLIRHAERCDRSKNQCLGDLAGITADGAKVAAVAGEALRTMGMQNTDIVSSPLLRTVQTSEAMFGVTARIVNRLEDCKNAAINDVITLKKAGRNLVVVTHSGCIDRYESQLNVGGTPSSGYVSALFVSKPERGAAKALGYLDAPAWQTLLNQASK